MLLIKELVGFKGELVFNASKPNSSMDKVLDCSKMYTLGWRVKIKLEYGIKMVYWDYLKHK